MIMFTELAHLLSEVNKSKVTYVVDQYDVVYENASYKVFVCKKVIVTK